MRAILMMTMVLATTTTAGVVNARDAATIYQSKCMACHTTGAAGAPKLGDKAAWEPRMAQGVDALLASAKTGKNAMPPMGTCMDCSDDELKSAIEHILATLQ